MLHSNGHNRDGTFKTTLENYHTTFLNSDFSLIIGSIFPKSLEDVIYCLPKGTLSRNFDLGPG